MIVHRHKLTRRPERKRQQEKTWLARKDYFVCFSCKKKIKIQHFMTVPKECCYNCKNLVLVTIDYLGMFSFNLTQYELALG